MSIGLKWNPHLQSQVASRIWISGRPLGKQSACGPSGMGIVVPNSGLEEDSLENSFPGIFQYARCSLTTVTKIFVWKEIPSYALCLLHKFCRLLLQQGAGWSRTHKATVQTLMSTTPASFKCLFQICRSYFFTLRLKPWPGPPMISCHPSFQAPKLQGGYMWWLSKSHKARLDFGPYESYERKFPFQVPTTQQFNFRASCVTSPPKKCHVGLRKRKATFQFCFSAGSM